ncbi:MAG: GWxTD domain-containing protein, partial [Flavobacteriales bacterium]
EIRQKFFYSFWKMRNPADPEGQWLKYKRKLKEVNRFYKTQIKSGYETDRGRIYLRYGPPNTIVSREHEPSSYPYEIWHYYNTNDGQSNVKFVFYDPDLTTNDYQLLHSTAIGEIKDYRWHLRLQMRNTPENNLDIGTGQDHWGSEAQDLFNHPR